MLFCHATLRVNTVIIFKSNCLEEPVDVREMWMLCSRIVSALWIDTLSDCRQIVVTTPEAGTVVNKVC